MKKLVQKLCRAFPLLALAILLTLLSVTFGGGKDIYGNNVTNETKLGYVDGDLTTVGDIAGFKTEADPNVGLTNGTIYIKGSTVTPITNLQGYATETWVESKGYATTNDIPVGNAITDGTNTITAARDFFTPSENDTWSPSEYVTDSYKYTNIRWGESREGSTGWICDYCDGQGYCQYHSAAY